MRSMFPVGLFLAVLFFSVTSMTAHAECGPGHTSSSPSVPGPTTSPPGFPTTVQEQIGLQNRDAVLKLPGQGPLIDFSDAEASKNGRGEKRVEKEFDEHGKLHRETKYDRKGRKIKETLYHDDGKTPLEDAEFYPDGGKKSDRFYDDKGDLYLENEFYLPGKGEENGAMKSSTSFAMDEHGKRIGRTRHEYDDRGRTVYSDEQNHNGSITTRYDPETGSAIDQVNRYPNGRVRSDTRFDPRTGGPISHKAFREDGGPESETTHYGDGSGWQQDFHTDGSVTNTRTDPEGNTTVQTVDRRGQIIPNPE